jgi:hypothetical protein
MRDHRLALTTAGHGQLSLDRPFRKGEDEEHDESDQTSDEGDEDDENPPTGVAGLAQDLGPGEKTNQAHAQIDEGQDYEDVFEVAEP